MDIHNTIHKLQSMMHSTHVFDPLQEDPYAVDALRGSMYEEKWRGTLTEYVHENPNGVPALAERAIERLEQLWPYSEGPKDTWPDYDYWIGLGTYGWKYNQAVISAAVQYGIRLIDTAETYGYGKVEECIGDALWEHTERESILVATKVSRSHMATKSIHNAVDRSSLRLGYDQIELYQVHWPNLKFPVSGVAIGLAELLEQGKVKRVGVCNHSIDQMLALQELLTKRGRGHTISTVQVRYNLLDRGAERGIIQYCNDRNIPVIMYSPFGQKFALIRRHSGWSELQRLAKKYHVTEAQISLAFCYSMGTPIPRTNNPDHAREIAEAINISLDPEDMDAIDDAFPIGE